MSYGFVSTWLDCELKWIQETQTTLYPALHYTKALSFMTLPSRYITPYHFHVQSRMYLLTVRKKIQTNNYKSYNYLK